MVRRKQFPGTSGRTGGRRLGIERLEQRRLLASAGPDGFGYLASDHALESIDLARGGPGVFQILDTANDAAPAGVSLSDDAFTFYGATYAGQDALWVGDNGLIIFGTYNLERNNGDLTSAPSQAAIAPLWDDWRTDFGGVNSAVFGKYEDLDGDGVHDRLIIEWSEAEHSPFSASPVTFQAILELNTGSAPGAIVFNYPDLDSGDANSNGASATVGIKDAGTQGSNRLLVSFNDGNNPLVGTGKAIRISRPGLYGSVFHDVNGDGTRASSEPVMESWTIFLDSNNNGLLDGTERSTTSDAQGGYAFLCLAPGAYTVVHVVQPGWVQSFPASGGHQVTVSDGEALTGLDFGNAVVEDPNPLSGWYEWDGSASGSGVSSGIGGSQFVELALDSQGFPVVAWIQQVGMVNHVYLARWSGSAWDELAGSATSDGLSAAIRASGEPLSLAVDSVGNPVVAWVGYGPDSKTDVYVRRWDGSAWVGLGGSDDPNGHGISFSGSDDRSPAISVGPDGNPVVAWGAANNTNIAVRRWDGSQWVAFGEVVVAADNTQESGPDLALDSNGRPLVAWYRWPTGSEPEIYLKRWDGAAWVEVGGSAIAGGISNTAGRSRYPALAVDAAGYPVVAWQEGTDDPMASAYVRRWNGSRWVELAGSANGLGLGQGLRPDVALDASGNPIVTWSRGATQFDTDILVRAWDGYRWATLAESASPHGITPDTSTATLPSLAVNAAGEPTVAWQRGSYPAGLDFSPETEIFLRGFAATSSETSNFAGLDYVDAGAIPPDTHAAAGLEHVVEVTNTAIAYFDKVTGFNRFQKSLADFFEPLVGFATNPFLFDPLVAFDELAGRFLVAVLKFDDAFNNSHLLYAVSNTSNPLDGFDEMHAIELTQPGINPAVRGNVWGDDPKVGWNAEAHVFTVNMYPLLDDMFTSEDDFDHVSIIAIDKDTILDADPATFSFSHIDRASFPSDGRPHFKLAPATMHGAQPGDPMWFVEEAGPKNGSQIRVVKLAGPLSGSPQFTDYDLAVSPYLAPPAAPQPGGGLVHTIDTDDTSIVNAEWRSGRLVAAHTVGIAADSQAHVRWYELDTGGATPRLLQEGTLNPGPGIHTYFPSIAMNATGEIGTTWMQSSTAEFLSMYVSGRGATDPLGQMRPPVLVKAGEALYRAEPSDVPPYNAGSYSGITVDPADNDSFWAANQYATSKALNNWGTWIANFALESEPADIQLRSLSADGFRTLTLTYEVLGQEAAAFDVGFYRSGDSEFDAGDIVLSSVAITDPAGRTVGLHTKTFTLGTEPGEIPLPGAGALESDTDYYLLAVADPADAIMEADADPLAEDNTAVLAGAYHVAGGDLLVHGTAAADAVAFSAGATLDLDLNGSIIRYAAAAVARLRVRTHAGNDTVRGGNVAKAMWVHGGPDHDTLQSGAANDVLDGGPGADTWKYIGTSAADTIRLSNDKTSGRLKLVRGLETDYFVFDAADTVHVLAGAGNDKLTVQATGAAAVTLPVRLEGEDGRDVLTGGAGPDVLLGGPGNDTLNGKLGADLIDGGPGTDVWIFEGTSAAEFVDLEWDQSTSQLVVHRRLSSGGVPLEVDVAALVENVTILGAAGNDQIDASLLSAADYSAAGLALLTLDGSGGHDTIYGSHGKDLLKGGSGNDTLWGQGGADIWQYQGSGGADHLLLALLAADQAQLVRRKVGSSTLLESDTFIFDSADRIEVRALGGNDQIEVAVDLIVPGVLAGGLVDGGPGTDSCTAPAGWTKNRCEG